MGFPIQGQDLAAAKINYPFEAQLAIILVHCSQPQYIRESFAPIKPRSIITVISRMGEVDIEIEPLGHEERDEYLSGSGNQASEEEPLATWRLSLILFSLCVGLMLSMMDNSIVSTSLYTIALEFGSLADGIWTVLAYTLSYLGIVNRLWDTR